MSHQQKAQRARSTSQTHDLPPFRSHPSVNRVGWRGEVDTSPLPYHLLKPHLNTQTSPLVSELQNPLTSKIWTLPNLPFVLSPVAS